MSVVGSVVREAGVESGGHGRVGDAPWTPRGHSSALGMACIWGCRGGGARLIESSCRKLEGNRRKVVMVLLSEKSARKAPGRKHMF